MRGPSGSKRQAAAPFDGSINATREIFSSQLGFKELDIVRPTPRTTHAIACRLWVFLRCALPYIAAGYAGVLLGFFPGFG